MYTALPRKKEWEGGCHPRIGHARMYGTKDVLNGLKANLHHILVGLGDASLHAWCRVGNI